jgi:LysR family transcriptional regulator of abg operon
VDAEWITTSVTHRAEDELTPLFVSHGLPAPRIVVQAHSALTFFFTVAHSDLLMMLPVQWETSAPFAGLLTRIDVGEPIKAPAIGIVRRSALPLTPAGEYFCDMIRRAAAHR